MTPQVRRIESIIIAREDDATPGTSVAASTGMAIPVTSGILRPVVKYDPINAGYGVNFNNSDQKVTTKGSELVFTAPVKSDWIGMILAGILGVVSSANSAGETDVRDHEFTLKSTAACALPSFTIYMLSDIGHKKATYGTVRKVTFNCESDGILTATVEMVAQAYEDATGTAAYTTDHHFQGSHLAVKIGANLAALDGAPTFDFSSMSLSFSREITAKQVFNNLEATKMIAGPLEVTGELGIVHEDDTERVRYEDGDEIALRLQFLNLDELDEIGISENPELRFDLAKVFTTNHQRPEGLDEVDMGTLSIVASYDLDENTPQFGSVFLRNEELATAYTEPA